MNSNEDKGSTFAICGRETIGLIVKSDGKSNPISLIFVFLIFPIDVLDGSSKAPVPIPEFILVIDGNE